MKKLALLAALLPAPVNALSCLQPDIVALYREIDASPGVYWLIRGRVELLQPVAWPKSGPDGNYRDDAEARTPIRLTGKALSPDGTYRPFSRDLVMTIGCVAVWCGAPPLDEEIFAAVKVTSAGPELWIGPCPWHAIPFTAEDEARLLACVREGDCRPR